MNFKHTIFSLFAITLLVACEVSTPDTPYKISVCAPMPNPRASAVSFVIDNQAYIFGGRDADGNYQNDLWRYDAKVDTWENLGETPLKSRVNATACVHNGLAYVGLGFNGTYGNSESYLTDWWCYNPQTNSWKQLSHYPDHTTARAISMVGDGELYVGYGFCWKYTQDMYRYDIENDRWDFIDVEATQPSNIPLPKRSFGGIGATCQGRYFAGTGFKTYSLDWWREFLPEGKWLKRKNVPGAKRTLAACASTDEFVYVIGGMHFGGVNTTGKVLNDIQQYNPQTDTWQHVGNLPNGGRINHVAFRIGNCIYVGLGEDENMQVCGDIYCILEK